MFRKGELAAVDVADIAEELETLGRTERRELMSRLVVLLTHRLKGSHQPDLRSRSWQLTIENQRDDISDHLAENPSLATQLDEMLHKAYRRARRQAERETGLGRATFKDTCPWSLAHIMDEAF